MKEVKSPMNLTLVPIGIIHSPFSSKEATPIQGAFAPEGQGRIEIYPEYAEGLKDIETFSHLILLYWFDRAGEVQLVRPTFLDDQPHGVFASRHPCRPNGLGLTVVRLLRREKNILEVSGIDVLDGTPLLDIKPYVPRFDSFPDAREGWLAKKQERPKPPDRE
jgi:tRNA-Thr(GGU) m(6)t(6)A37 methyltransferase TsaA